MKKLLLMMGMVLGMLGCAVPREVRVGDWHYGKVVGYHGVAGKVVVPVYIDRSFTISERAAINGAFGEWDRVFNGLVVFKKGGEFDGWDGGEALYEGRVKPALEGFILVRGSGSDIRTVVSCGERALACADLGGPTMVVVMDRIGTRDLKTILTHEIGHMMGSGHMHTRGLMYPYYGKDQMECPDKLVVSEVAAHYGLQLSELNYCIGSLDFK